MPHIDAYHVENYDQDMIEVIDHCLLCSDFSSRLRAICQYFKGRPYQLWCVGDGERGKFNQKPQYRTDYFDCMTYMNTCLALAFSKDILSFKTNYRQIQYRQGECWFERNYFFESDWVSHNQRQGFISRSSADVSSLLKKPIYSASTIIDKPAWIRCHQLKDIFLLNYSDQVAHDRLSHLHAGASSYEPEENYLPYVALGDLLNSSLKCVLNMPPQVVAMVRPNWQVEDLIGTRLNVSHVGLLLPDKAGERWCFFHASSDLSRVVEVDFIEYLQFCHDKIPQVAGVSFFSIAEDFQS